MNMTSDDEKHGDASTQRTGSRQVVYLPSPDANGSGDGAIDLRAIWQIIWGSKALISICVFVFVAAAATYSLLAKQWFTAEVLLTPAQNSSLRSALAGLPSQLGALASLAGVNVGDGKTAEPLAVLKSRELTSSFIEDHKLLTVLFADDWDANTQKWKIRNQKNWPDLRDAVKYFDKEIRAVNEDTRTGLVTLSIQWTDPASAAEWANELVDRVNARMRDRALEDANRNLEYLRSELEKTQVLALQQSIGSLIQSELQKLMLAKGNNEFSYRIIDHARPPKRRSSPKRTLIVILAFLAGVALSVVYVLMRASLQGQPSRTDSGA